MKSQMGVRHSSWPHRVLLCGVFVAAVAMIAPVLWAIGLSLKPNAELAVDSAAVFHGPYTLRNYADILVDSHVARWLFNSVVVSLGVTLGVLILSSLAGYAFARLQFPGKRTLFVLMLLGLAIPEQAVIIPRHHMFSLLDLHNSYLGLILPGLVAPFGVFLMTQYFKAIPRELDDAALLDHSSRFGVFWRVLLPLTVPAQVTLGIFTFIAAWNDYWWPMISGTNESMYTLTVGIASMQMNFAESAGLGFLTAQAMFAALPILAIYFVFQKHLVRTVSSALQG